ncbi:MAG: hypothetical protein J6O15_03445 [Acinetobacter sp.]|nr:hypothetical protein [Acinetobacter sp.]
MSKKSIKQFTDLSNKILDGVLKLFGYTFILLLAVIIMLYLAFSIWLGNIRDEQNVERLLQSQNYDRQTFPYLAEHVFFYKRMHVGDSGNWVVVYPLDALTKKKFLLQYRNQENQPQSHQIECIKPTIKKRWKSWHSNIHYVQPDEWSKGHNDHKVHDSFIVYGSEQQIKIVERACMDRQFKKLVGKDVRPHNYWAISEKEKLLFSVYEID